MSIKAHHHVHGRHCPPAVMHFAMRTHAVATHPVPLDGDAKRRERSLDATLGESFPASDPPGWTLGGALSIPRSR